MLNYCRHELFDEYTRRQYLSRAPEKNPFGSNEVATKFADFDVLIKVSHVDSADCLRH